LATATARPDRRRYRLGDDLTCGERAVRGVPPDRTATGAAGADASIE
jgi:hypothetical protein